MKGHLAAYNNYFCIEKSGGLRRDHLLETVAALLEGDRYKGTIVRRLTLVLACLLCPILAAANPPNQANFQACSRGESQREAQVKPVEFANLYQDDHNRSGYAVTYAIKNKKRIGFAVKGEQQGIFYEGRVYPIDHAATINITPNEYQEQLRHSGMSLSQRIGIW